MTAGRDEPEQDQDPGRTPASPDAAHLDEDAEALEDPVHSGDARHQQEHHRHQPRAD